MCSNLMRRRAAPLPALVAFSAGLALAAPAQALDANVVANVDGVAITEDDVRFALSDFREQLQQIPEEQRRKVVVGLLVDMTLFANKARALGLDETDEFKKRTAFLQTRALRNAFFVDQIEKSITEDMLRARYDKDVANITPEQEVRARHILVETEDEAKAVIKELTEGADFAETAKSKSTGPSGPNGGDLGFFGKGQMVPEFEAAAFGLEAGQITVEPIKTRFGWHVIKVEEKRDRPLPAYDDVKDQVRSAMLRERFDKVLEDLKADATVEISEQDQ